MRTFRKMLAGMGVLSCLVWIGMTISSQVMGYGNAYDVYAMIVFFFFGLIIGWPLGHLIDRMTETNNGN